MLIINTVADDGKSRNRVLSDRGIRIALDYKHAGKRPENSSSPEVPDFVGANNLKPFIPKDFSSSPILYQPLGNRPVVKGYDARILPQICSVYLKARRAGALHKSQERIAAACVSIIVTHDTERPAALLASRRCPDPTYRCTSGRTRAACHWRAWRGFLPGPGRCLPVGASARSVTISTRRIERAGQLRELLRRQLEGERLRAAGFHVRGGLARIISIKKTTPNHR